MIVVEVVFAAWVLVVALIYAIFFEERSLLDPVQPRALPQLRTLTRPSLSTADIEKLQYFAGACTSPRSNGEALQPRQRISEETARGGPKKQFYEQLPQSQSQSAAPVVDTANNNESVEPRGWRSTWREDWIESDVNDLPENEELFKVKRCSPDKLKARRQELYDMIFSETSEKRIKEADCICGEHRNASLLRFLNARDQDVGKAYKMIANSIKWRKEYGILGDSDGSHPVRGWRFPPLGTMQPVDKDVSSSMRRFNPHGWLGFNRKSQLIYVEKQGSMDISGLIAFLCEKSGTKTSTPDIHPFIHYHVQMMQFQEKVIFPRESRKQGVLLDKVCGIFDLKGLGSKHLTRFTLSVLQKLTACDQDNFPELLAEVYIVNAPWLFSAAWGIIKGFLHKNVQEKITILSGSVESQSQVLCRKLGEECVPDYLGGKYRCPRGGPCVSTSEGDITDSMEEFDAFYDWVCNGVEPAPEKIS